MPLHSDVHIDRPLSNFAVKYKNEAFIAQALAPFVPVMHKSDKYITFTQKDGYTVPETIRGPKDTANEVDWSTSSSTYGCVDHAIREFISDAIVENSDPAIMPRQRTTEMLTDLLMLDFEIDIATLTTTAGNYGANYKTTLSGGDQWSAHATSDPMTNVQTGKDACFKEPNTIVMGKTVWTTLRQHPQILDRVSGGSTNFNPARVTPELVAELFEVDNLYIGKAKKNDTNKAQTASFTDVWGDFVVIAYVEQQPTLDGCCAWKTFLWNQLATNLGYQVRTYRDESRGGGGEFIEVETSRDSKVICADVAYLISDLVA